MSSNIHQQSTQGTMQSHHKRPGTLRPRRAGARASAARARRAPQPLTAWRRRCAWPWWA